jgi:hypothetical protein
MKIELLVSNKTIEDSLVKIELIEEDIHRRLACEIVKEMPLEALKHLFELKKTDPSDEEIQQKSIAGTLTKGDYLMMMDLRRRGVVKYTVSFVLPGE